MIEQKSEQEAQQPQQMQSEGHKRENAPAGTIGGMVSSLYAAVKASLLSN